MTGAETFENSIVAEEAEGIAAGATTAVVKESDAALSAPTVEEGITEPVEEEAGEAASTEAEAKPKSRRKSRKATIDDLLPKDDTKPKDRPWYVLKVQSNREDSIREALLRRIKIARLEEFVNEITVPTERVSEIKGGKKRIVERKYYPGYIMCQLELTEDLWYTIRETPGIGDFISSGGKPLAMTEIDIAKMLGLKPSEGAKVEQPKLKIAFKVGDRVKIKEGPFENFEGNVEEVNETKGKVRVVIQIFGRPNPVELGYWEIEPV